MHKPHREKTFIWQGLNIKGERVQGILTCLDRQAALKALLKLDISLLEIGEKRTEKIFALNKKVPSKNILIFLEQLASLISSNITLIRALKIIKGNATHLPTLDLITSIKNEIEKGLPLSKVLKGYPEYFSDFSCNLIKAGEKSAALDIMLNHLAAYNEKAEVMRRKLKKVLFYPSLVLIIAILVTSGLIIFVVPEFQAMFHSFGAILPTYTRAIINLALFLKAQGGFLFGILFGILASFIFVYKSNEHFAFFFDRNVFKLPYFGMVVKKTIIAQFARVLSITFAAGLPLPDILEMTAEIIGNRLYKNAILQIRWQVINGESLKASIKSTSLFPQYVLELVTIGEETGTLGSMLAKIASYYEDEVNYATENLQNLLEPVTMITLGTLIGSIIIGMYLPIFELGKIM